MEKPNWREQAEKVLPKTRNREVLFHGFYWWDIYDEEDVLGATIDFFKQAHHATFVRVEEQVGMGWTATKDPFDRLGDIYNLYSDTELIPVEIPGIDGHWMLVIHPFGD